MTHSKFYTNIYIRYSTGRSMNLVFYNYEYGYSLLYNGLEFCFIENPDFDFTVFKELDYSVNARSEKIVIEKIKSDFDISYILLANGDVFQMFYLIDNADSLQQLLIFKPADKYYHLALSRLNEEEDAEIIQGAINTNVIDWFNNKK